VTGPAEAPRSDPLYRNTDLSYVVRLPVLGVPVAFATNSPAARDAVAEWFGMWEHLARYPALLSADATRIRIIEHEGMEGGPGRPPIRYRMPDAERILLHTRGSMGLVDVRRGDAVAYVTPELVADRDHFQYGILEAMVLVLIALRDRLPLHAALVVRNGVAILLAGQSGLGKSTVAYQALRAGWTLLADDAVFVQTTPTNRLWGGARRLYLPPDAARWFPELAGREAQVQANGKTKIALPHAHDWRSIGPPVVERAAICLLGRSAGPATLERIDPEVVRSALLEDLTAVHDLHREDGRRVIPPLCAGGGWRLALSQRPPDAAPLLEDLARQVAMRW
jgi:hypothetical protein